MPKINKYKALRLTNLDENLSKNEKLIYGHLILCFDEVKGFAYPSYPELMQVLGVKRRNSVADTVETLRSKVYIETKKGYRGANNYYLLKYITSNKCITSNENDTSNKNDTPLVTKPLLNNIKDNINNKLNKKELKKGTNLDFMINEYTQDEELKQALKDFLKMRKTIKSPMTERALTMLFDKLDKLEDSTERKILILNQSIFNNWKGIFPITDNQKQHISNVVDVEFGKSKIDYESMTPEQIMELGRGK